MGVLVEICCGSTEDVLEAEKGGADRVELCSALPLGGLTPSAATLAEVKSRTKVPVMVMIRPRGGAFCYSEEELSTMEREIEMAGEFGADGFVFGVLKSDGTVDLQRNRRLVSRCGGRPTVFHRAFDVTPDPVIALEMVIDVGFKRLLTSGQQATALEGAPLIHYLNERAEDAIEIMPGGRIRLDNLEELVAATGCSEMHMRAHRCYPDESAAGNGKICFGTASAEPGPWVDVVDANRVRELVTMAGRL